MHRVLTGAIDGKQLTDSNVVGIFLPEVGSRELDDLLGGFPCASLTPSSFAGIWKVEDRRRAITPTSLW